MLNENKILKKFRKNYPDLSIHHINENKIVIYDKITKLKLCVFDNHYTKEKLIDYIKVDLNSIKETNENFIEYEEKGFYYKVFFARKKCTKLQRKIHNIARKSTQKMCIFLLTHC